MQRFFPLVAVVLACADPPGEVLAAVPLTPEEQLTRLSISLRGTRPTIAQLDDVARQPARVDRYVDAWLQTPAFGRTLRDLHAEVLLLRVDVTLGYPALGLMQDYNLGQINRSVTEAPLHLVEDIVMSGRPYTEILTADYILADPVVATIYDLPYDPEGETWQRTWWTDGRPAAGLLSSSEFYRRWPSNGNNYHRSRANAVATTFLCDDVESRHVEPTDGALATDPEAVAVAVTQDPACLGCHGILEPMAAFFWGFKPTLPARAMRALEYDACEVSTFDEIRDVPPGSGYPDDLCYPLRVYVPGEEGQWASLGLPPPALYGQRGDRVDDLGRMVTEDPRFATCTARRFYGWFTQTALDEVPQDIVDGLAAHFVGSGYDARALVREIVLSEAFLSARPLDPADPTVGLLTVRPEQYARQIETLTGFEWWENVDDGSCDECQGAVDLARSDLFGYRQLAGGIDGYTTTHPTHLPTPSQALTLGRWALEAASHAVDRDFAGTPQLLTGVTAESTDADAIRAQLVDLHHLLLGEVLAPDSETIDATFILWADALARHGNTHDAWKITLGALLSDVRMVLY